MAIWVVERIFDTGAVVAIWLFDIFFIPSVQNIHYYDKFRTSGYVIAVGFAALVAGVLWIWFWGPSIASWFCRRISGVAPRMGSALEVKIRAFSEGLNTVHNVLSFIQVTVLSLGIWMLVLLAYRQVTHAYPVETGLRDLDFPQVTLLMGASVAGGVLQLPVVGGGSQLATIGVLDKVLSIRPEDAVSCGILLWLVTFMSVMPLGLILARHEHVSLRNITLESQKAEARIQAGIAESERERRSRT